MRRLLAFAVVGLAALAAGADDKAAKADLEKLAGTWTVTAVEAAGMKLEPGKEGPDTLNVKGNKLTLALQGKELMAVEVEVDPTKKPKAIDLIRDKSGKKEELPCIYELTGDGLKLAMPMPPRDPKPGERLTRPGSFDTKDKPVMVLVAKRAKK